MFYPQANFYPQTSFAQLAHPNAMYPNNMYATGVPQQTPFFSQQTPFFSQLPFSNWQQPQLTRQLGINGFNGIGNGAVQPGIGSWAQPQVGQVGLEQINPALQQFSPALQQVPYLLQQLAQYHNVIAVIAQQLAQVAHVAAHTALLSSGATYPFAGQFIPNQLSPNF